MFLDIFLDPCHYVSREKRTAIEEREEQNAADELEKKKT